MIKKTLFVAVLFSITCSYAQIDKAFTSFQESKALQGALIGFSVKDLKKDSTVFSYNGKQLFYPASVQKTITTATALQLLGSDFNYETKVFYTGEIIEGVLNGNLIIEASGDPTTNSIYFSNDLVGTISNYFTKNKIQKIAGKVILGNGGNYHNTLPTWLYEDIANYYGAAPQILNFQDNYYTIYLQQTSDGKHPSLKSTSPKMPYQFVLNLTCSSSIKGDQAYIMGSPFTKEREIIGTIPSGSGSFKFKGANAHPLESFLLELRNQVQVEGGSFENANRVLLLTQGSPSLKRIIKTTNGESVNLFAEGVLNTLGLEFSKEYTAEAGLEVITNFIVQRNYNAQEIHLKDGSGLSRLNAMSPDFAVNWMCDFYENKDFLASLPISGETGTMRYLNHVGIKGKVQAKSGSAEGVVNYAGYITRNNGEVYAFSIFINNAFQSKYSIRREIGVLLESIL